MISKVSRDTFLWVLELEKTKSINLHARFDFNPNLSLDFRPCKCLVREGCDCRVEGIASYAES